MTQFLSGWALRATRFVDDFRIFLNDSEDPYDVLSVLAEHLGISEGLALNAAKTRILDRAKYLEKIASQTTDFANEAHWAAIADLSARLYANDEEIPQEDLEILKNSNLLDMLDSKISEVEWDIGDIRVILRVLRIISPRESIDYIHKNLRILVIFSKELCLWMEEVQKKHPNCFDNLRDSIIDSILAPPASSVQVIRTWLLEIFVRQIIKIPPSKIKRLDGLSSILDARQLYLIRGANDDIVQIRKKKAAISSHPNFLISCLLWSGSCMPKDEYENWMKTATSVYNKPTSNLFIRWAIKHQASLCAKLSAGIEDHLE